MANNDTPVHRFHTSDIQSMDKRYRNNLVNSLSGFKSANLIGTVDEKGVGNLGTFSSVTHLGSNPALLGFILRPTTVPRNTYQNLKANGHYTINHIPKDYVEQAHQASAKYEPDVDEFEVCGLTKEWSEVHTAPYVQESQVQIGLAYEEEYPIKANGTILVIGRIVEVRLKGGILLDDGYVDLAEAGTVTINGLDGYLAPEKMVRLSYARPNEALREI